MCIRDRALAGPDPVQSLGRVFDGLEESLRRPVEIFGLLHLATNQAAVHRHADTERYSTIRPDGSSRALDVPRITPTPPTTHVHEATPAAQTTDTTATAVSYTHLRAHETVLDLV